MLMVSTAVASGCMASVALAQTQSTASASAVGAVVVTAERRPENVQNVPIDVSVVSAKEIEQRNLVTVNDLANAVPAVTISGGDVFQIRGLGTQVFSRSAEQSVSVVIDGVVMPRPGSPDLSNIFDLDHVEVLSGPQGTLFGKNADAGVINIVTKAPVLGHYQAIGHADFGGNDYTNLDAVANLPIGDDAALRLSLHRDTNGRNVYNITFGLWDYNQNDAVRARLLFKPTPNLTVNISADYQKQASNGVNGNPDGGIAVELFTFVPPGAPALSGALAACGVTPNPGNNRTCGSSLYAPGVNTDGVYGEQGGGGSIQIDWNPWRDLTLTSVTAERLSRTSADVDGDLAGAAGDGLPATLNVLKRNMTPTNLRQFSEEARVQNSAGDRLSFVAGAYFSDLSTRDIVDQAGQLGLGFLLPPGAEFRRLNTVVSDQTNYAGFGQANFKVTPTFILLAGVRVTHDNLSDFSFNRFPQAAFTDFPFGFVGQGPYVYTGDVGSFSQFPISSCTVAGGVPALGVACAAGTSVNTPAKLSTTGVNWKAGLEYHFDTSVMAYATVTSGYKGPFINDQASYPITAAQLVVKPESAYDYEIGLKSTLFHRVAVDLSLFDQTTYNFQTTIFVPPPPGGVYNFVYGNAPYAVTRGVELNVFGAVTTDFDLNADLLYDNSYFSPDFMVECNSPNGAVPCRALRQMPYAPVWKAALAGEYHHNLTNGVQGFLQSDFTFTSSYPYGSAPPPTSDISGPRYLLGFRLGARSDNARYSVAVFCRNCLDERYPEFAGPYLLNASVGGAPAGQRPAQAQILSLDSYRVVGVTLDGRF
ncbi:MAG TPA: TonB-dependent receptor [Caulobacteraceae bacterium]|jgi:iron complex outermembrane receptor protein|nr:TonB-dependent receptor [Caulobacteraceae bacterium]